MRKALLFAGLSLLLIMPAAHSAENKKERYFLRLDALLATGLDEPEFSSSYLGWTLTPETGYGASIVGGIENPRSKIEFGATWLSFRYSQEIRDSYDPYEPPIIRRNTGHADLLNLHVAFLFPLTSRGSSGLTFGPMLGWKISGGDPIDDSGFSYGLRLAYPLPHRGRHQLEVGLQYLVMPTGAHAHDDSFSFLSAQIGLRFGRTG